MTIEPDGKCVPILGVLEGFQVEEGGTSVRNAWGWGQASLSGSPSASVMLQWVGKSRRRDRGGDEGKSQEGVGEGSIFVVVL